jgi:excisionase family DNA binding protein
MAIELDGPNGRLGGLIRATMRLDPADIDAIAQQVVLLLAAQRAPERASIVDDRFYSVGELARVTGYHRDSIYRAIESGALAAAKPRGRWLIPGSAINAWLQTAQPSARDLRALSEGARRRGENRRRGTPDSRPSFRELARRRAE